MSPCSTFDELDVAEMLEDDESAAVAPVDGDGGGWAVVDGGDAVVVAVVGDDDWVLGCEGGLVVGPPKRVIGER